MKKLLCAALLLTLTQFAQAGGNSSLIEIAKVKSVKIEEGKITIVGDGIIKKRVFTDEENKDSTIFGQPAQWQVTKVRECTFEVVPYGVRADIAGVPGGGPENMTPERRKKMDAYFAKLVGVAKTIKPGDAAHIGYQSDRAVLLGYKITHIVGEGSLRKVEKDK